MTFDIEDRMAEEGIYFVAAEPSCALHAFDSEEKTVRQDSGRSE